MCIHKTYRNVTINALQELAALFFTCVYVYTFISTFIYTCAYNIYIYIPIYIYTYIHIYTKKKTP